ncbi:MAG: type VI secretion system protein TssA [Pyrinomonadaceae bacterium]
MEIALVPPVIDLEGLLQPIPGENPSGEFLQYSGVYDEIREARRADDNLSQGTWQHELKVADWRQVVKLSTAALQMQSKDLQIGAWLTEALVKEYGFAGMRDGLKLMCGLHENFWETFFPEIDEGDLEARANALEFMDRQASFALKETALTSGAELSYFKWEESRSFDIPDNIEGLESSLRDKAKALSLQAQEEKRTTTSDWRNAKAATRRPFYEEKFALLNECWEAFTALDVVIDEKFGKQTPGLNAIKKSLDDVRTIVKKLVEEKRLEEPDPSDNAPEEATETGEEGAAATNGATSSGTGMGGAIRTRQDALKRLSEVATFFRSTEPHSPVSYLVQKAVRWGNMPLETWLQEVIKDTGVLSQLNETLGVSDQPSEQQS